MGLYLECLRVHSMHKNKDLFYVDCQACIMYDTSLTGAPLISAEVDHIRFTASIKHALRGLCVVVG